MDARKIGSAQHRFPNQSLGKILTVEIPLAEIIPVQVNAREVPALPARCGIKLLPREAG